MDSKNQLRQLFKYDLWANQKVAAALKKLPFETEKKCRNLFAHIDAAQKIWHARIYGKPDSDIELWPEEESIDYHLEQITRRLPVWLQLIESTDLKKVVSYQNSKSTRFDTLLGGILHHILIHGQHHRAQIAGRLRHNDIDPPATDFIFYLRETDND